MHPPGEITDQLVADGYRWPAVFLPAISPDPARAVRAERRSAEIDPGLASAGAGHVASLRARGARLWDGPVLVYDRVEGDAVVCRPARYLAVVATSMALEAELAAAGPGADPANLPLRARATECAGGDPIATGRGRASAVGLNIAVVATGAGRHALLGRRSARMAAAPGRWSFVAGNVEPGDGRRPLPSALARELDEEMPALAGPEAERCVAGARVLGACLSIGRLGPTLLAAGEIDAEPDDLGDLDAGEFDETRVLDLDDPGRCWNGLGPDSLVASSAALLDALTTG